MPHKSAEAIAGVEGNSATTWLGRRYVANKPVRSSSPAVPLRRREGPSGVSGVSGEGGRDAWGTERAIPKKTRSAAEGGCGSARANAGSSTRCTPRPAQYGTGSVDPGVESSSREKRARSYEKYWAKRSAFIGRTGAWNAVGGIGEGVERKVDGAGAVGDRRTTRPCVGMCASRRTDMHIVDGTEPSGRSVTVVLWTLKERQSSLIRGEPVQPKCKSAV